MKICWLKTLFWLGATALLVLALLPPDVPQPSTGWDKSNHVLGFAVLAFTGLLAYPSQRVAVLSGLLLHGGLIELLQSLTTYRSAEWADFWGDGLGIMTGLVFATLWLRLFMVRKVVPGGTA